MNKGNVESFLGIPVPALPESNVPLIRPDLVNMPQRIDYAWVRIREGLKNHILNLAPGLTKDSVQTVVPSSRIGADLTIICHEMSKTLRKDPARIAQELATGFNLSPNPETVKEAKAEKGFLNFWLNQDTFGGEVISEVERFKERYGEQNLGEGKTLIIDCSSPNVAKYMSVGHLRSTIIGESLTRIQRAAGYRVIRDNHLGDWGTQFGMLARAYELWGNEYGELRDNTDPVNGLYKLYVRITGEIKKEKEAERTRLGLTEKDEVEVPLEKEGKKWFQRLESGDQQAAKLLEWATEQSLAEFKRVYSLLGSEYEYMLGESFYVSMVPAVLSYLKEKGIADYNETGAMVVDLSDRKLNHLVVQKSDETSLYASRDLATLVARTAWFNPEKILYVVGEDQQEYFKQVFATFEKMTNGTGPKMEHIHFGMIRLPAGKMSTRAGNVIFLEDVLNEAIERAKQRTNDVDRNLSDTEKETIARQIGLGAVVFSDLGQGREKVINFDWDKALSFQGHSGPYIQYAHARMKALLRRAEEENVSLDTNQSFAVSDETEFALLKQVSQFSEAVAEAGLTNSPNVVAEHAFRTASLFTDFYSKIPIFRETDVNRRNNLLRITQTTAQVIKNGLNLLCIEAPERM